MRRDFVSPRFFQGHRRIESEMYIDLLRQIDMVYHLTRPDVHSSPTIHYGASEETAFIEESVKAITGPGFRSIPPQLQYTHCTASGELKVPKYLRQFYRHHDIVKSLDMVLQSRNMFADFDWDYLSLWQFHVDNIWQSSYIGTFCAGIDDPPLKPKDGVPSLFSLVCASMSNYNKVFGHNQFGNFVKHSHENLKDKIPHQYVKYAEKGGDIPPDKERILKHISKAAYHVQVHLGLAEYEQAFTPFVYEAMVDDISMSSKSSAGIRPGPEGTNGGKIYDLLDGVRLNCSANGKKCMQQEYKRDCFKAMIRDWKGDGTPPTLEDPWWKYVIKQFTEIIDGKRASHEKWDRKIRTFCIDTPMRQLLTKMYDTFRHKVEMHSSIGIGFNWLNGGANKLANDMKFLDPDYRFATFDVSGLDFSIYGVFLEVYSYMSLWCFNYDGDREFYDFCVAHGASSLALKLCHMYGNVWKRIRGQMPSGAFETSHGDSWIMLLFFMIYCEIVIEANPHLTELIDEVREQIIKIVIYGDDTIYSYHRDVREWFSCGAYCSWLLTDLNITTRDVEDVRRPLSLPDLVTGDYRYRGVVWLQRSFVSVATLAPAVRNYPGLPAIVPYKDASKTIKKFAFGSGNFRTPLCYCVVAIGMAYDTQGTNLVSYEFCREAFGYYWNYCGISSAEHLWNLVEAASCDPEQEFMWNEILGKYQVDKEDIIRGFPSLDLLLERHVCTGPVNARHDPESVWHELMGKYAIACGDYDV
jgi:hypothetical protein